MLKRRGIRHPYLYQVAHLLLVPLQSDMLESLLQRWFPLKLVIECCCHHQDHHHHQRPSRTRWFIVTNIAFAWVSLLVPTMVTCERAYPFGCSHEDPSYYDYDNYPFPPPNVPLRTIDDYLWIRRLGTGRFSDVMEAVENDDVTSEESIQRNGQPCYNYELDPRTLVVIKCLKPISFRKVKRELLVLSHTSHLPNLVQLLAVVAPLPSTCSKGGEESMVAAENSDMVLHGSSCNSAYPVNHDDTSHNTTPCQKETFMPSLVLQHAGPNSQYLCHGIVHRNGYDPFLSDYEIQYYLLHLLVALDSLHSMSIMHRDIKPRNILINRLPTHEYHRHYPKPQAAATTFHPNIDSATNHYHHYLSSPYHNDDDDFFWFGPLTLIDLGLADFYLPNHRYNVRVASRHYKSPELLVGYETYDYAIDMWGVGCILAGLLLRREPFFRGSDNQDQLAKIINILGTRDFIRFMTKYKIPMTLSIQSIIDQYNDEQIDEPIERKKDCHHHHRTKTCSRNKQCWSSLVRSGCPIPSPSACSLLDGLLAYDPEKRFTARQAMRHPYFDNVRQHVMTDLTYQKF